MRRSEIATKEPLYLVNFLIAFVNTLIWRRSLSGRGFEFTLLNLKAKIVGAPSAICWFVHTYTLYGFNKSLVHSVEQRYSFLRLSLA